MGAGPTDAADDITYPEQRTDKGAKKGEYAERPTQSAGATTTKWPRRLKLFCKPDPISLDTRLTKAMMGAKEVGHGREANEARTDER